jgi:hypothetical protein
MREWQCATMRGWPLSFWQAPPRALDPGWNNGVRTRIRARLPGARELCEKLNLTPMNLTPLSSAQRYPPFKNQKTASVQKHSRHVR